MSHHHLLLRLLLSAFIACFVAAQQAGHQKNNERPPLSVSQCVAGGSCTAQQASIVLDSNWMWTHKVGASQNCYTGNEWDSTLCPDPQTCATNCALDGGDYESTYGVSTNGNSLQINFVTKGQYSTNVGARTFLMDPSGDKYQMFQLKNKEFTFTVDDSTLVCGLNGALYFVEMDADGGLSKYPTNNAGAPYGTGYCDAQCPRDLKFINGLANSDEWQPSPVDPNSGVGKFGTCCTEMDVWEGNSISQAYTPHACTVNGQTACNGTSCGSDTDRYSGVCDRDGGDFASYRLGNTSFWGPGSDFMVDSSKPVTVVTQFITSDKTDTGDLVEIRRLYVQDGKLIQNSQVSVGGTTYDSITDDFVKAEKTAFGDHPSFLPRGGLKAMGDSMARGHVLVMSLWADFAAHMLWLDSDYPTSSPATQPGVARGTCPTSSGNPPDIISSNPNANVVFSDIKWGPIGSTYGPGPGPTPTPTPTGCPGGSLQACMGLCPTSPPAAYKACVDLCAKDCPSAFLRGQ